MKRLFLLLICAIGIHLLGLNNLYAHSLSGGVMVVVDNLPYKINQSKLCQGLPLVYFSDSLPPKDIKKAICLHAEGYQQNILLVRTAFASNGYLMVNQLVYKWLQDAKKVSQPHNYQYYINSSLITENNIKSLIKLRRSQIKKVEIEQDDDRNCILVNVTKRSRE